MLFTFELLFSVTAFKQDKNRCDNVQRNPTRTVTRCNTSYLPVKNEVSKIKVIENKIFIYLRKKTIKKKTTEIIKKSLRHAIF